MQALRPLILPLCVLLLIAAVLCRLGVGGPAQASAPPPGTMPFFKSPIIELRAQRAIAGAVVGAAAALSGVMLQCLFRNPLASPDLLGMASGAGLGVMVSAFVGYQTSGVITEVGLAATGPPALVGALGALALTYAFSQRRGIIDPPSLLLVGVIVGVLSASLTQFVQYLLPDRGVSAGRWLLGAINDDVTWTQSTSLGLVVIAAAIITARLAPAMDAASLTDDEARSLGIHLSAVRAWLFVGSGMLAAASVVLAGPIAFVGLLCPHLVRIVAGPTHRTLIPAAAIVGGALVVGADTLVKIVELPAGRLPISVLTSLLGGPLLIVLLRRRETLV
ncbi:MAG: hypothetical protein AMXMBFR58_25690 [Phycisphaerae bacterium]|nr:putative ABC transporter permease protein [Phycisphaerales bacterium]